MYFILGENVSTHCVLYYWEGGRSLSREEAVKLGNTRTKVGDAASSLGIHGDDSTINGLLDVVNKACALVISTQVLSMVTPIAFWNNLVVNAAAVRDLPVSEPNPLMSFLGEYGQRMVSRVYVERA